jgi:hypothetical protein
MYAGAHSEERCPSLSSVAGRRSSGLECRGANIAECSLLLLTVWVGCTVLANRLSSASWNATDVVFQFVLPCRPSRHPTSSRPSAKHGSS